MKILIVSDVENRYLYDNFNKENFKDIELIISCGDLKRHYLEFLVTMLNVPLLYVPGNHDDAYDKDPPIGCIDIDMKGFHYKGVYFAGIGGARRYKQGVYQYTDFQMSLRTRKMKKHFKKADVVVTHAPPLGIGDRDSFVHKGFKCFLDAMDKYQFKYLIHGHNHLNYDRAGRVKTHGTTQVINAYDYYVLEI